MAGYVFSPRPRDVPGFAEAAAAGSTPRRPLRPPPLLPGTTAHQAFVRCGVLLAGATLVVVTVTFGGDNDGSLTVWEVAMMLAMTAIGVAVVVGAGIGPFRRVLLAELAAGYVTTTFHQGLFWFVRGPGSARDNDGVGWVWDGVWVLTSAGSVVSTPDPDVDPPGFYPSPNEAGQLELWTGCQWTGVRRDGLHRPA